jgi:hypothetical protein
MNKNIFVNQSNKYNPDIINKFNNVKDKRENIQYENKNNPYRMIIQENIPKKINNSHDFVIKDDKKVNVKGEYLKLLKARKYLDHENKDNKKVLNDDFTSRENLVRLMSDKGQDFKQLKKERKKYYSKEKDKLEKEKARYNDLLSSLKIKGII